MRFFLTLAYNGANYCGWQRQPNASSVQQTLETVLSTILQENIEITGCGRTDTGVHASHYIAHFDTSREISPSFLIGVNSLLPYDIAVYTCDQVADDAHARFHAVSRSYEYHISTRKDPFGKGITWFYPQSHKLDREKMQQAAALIAQYDAFFPFCKTHSGVEHYRCQIFESRWVFDKDPAKFVFHISANRFLRGMVRLIVGACIQAGMGQLVLEDIRKSLDEQVHLPKNLSVPPDGLFLTNIKYGGGLLNQ